MENYLAYPNLESVKMMPEYPSFTVIQSAMFHKENKFYSCPNCRKIPQIFYQNNSTVKVKCKCNFKKEYSMDEFLKEIEEEKETFCSHAKHKDKKATRYCMNCLKNFCVDCVEYHDGQYSDHRTTSCVQFHISSVCEESNCQGKIKFYCKTCGLHICDRCLKTHNSHQYLDFKDFIQKTELNKINDYLTEYENSIQQEALCWREVRNKTMKAFMDWDIYLNDKQIEHRKILTYLKSLLAALSFTSEFYNFNAMENLITNGIPSIQQKKREETMEKFKELFNYKNYGIHFPETLFMKKKKIEEATERKRKAEEDKKRKKKKQRKRKKQMKKKETKKNGKQGEEKKKLSLLCLML